MKKVKTQYHSQRKKISIEKTAGYIGESRGGVDQSKACQPGLYHHQQTEVGPSFSALCHIECGAKCGACK